MFVLCETKGKAGLGAVCRKLKIFLEQALEEKAILIINLCLCSKRTLLRARLKAQGT